jgi:hypothetical protein
MLHRDIRGRWYELEKKLIWCQERLGAGMFVPWGTVLPSAPATFGYLRSHENAKLAIKVALRSRNAFLCTLMLIFISIASRPTLF